MSAPPAKQPYPGGYPGQGFVPPPVGPPQPGQGRGSGRRGALIAAIVVCLAAAGGGATWYFVRGDDGTSDSSSSAAYGAPQSEEAPSNGKADSSGSGSSVSATPSRSTAPTTSGAPAAPTVSPEQQALVELERMRADSLPRLVLDGRWVAQVASKSVGITDPLQTAANGTHTFYAVDILAESRAATASVAKTSVLVLRSTDFGKRSFAPDGQAYWITVVDVGFTSSDQVDAWCASTYPTLTPEQLANACAPRTLVPPHD